MARNTPAAKTAKKETAGTAEQGLKVMTRAGTFWRGGRQWGLLPQVVPLSELTPEQARQIREEGEPGGELLVEEVDVAEANAAIAAAAESAAAKA